MGIYLLNISVDSADPNPQNIPEDLSFNDQESIIELVVEKVLVFENAIEEYDEHDSEEHNTRTIDQSDLIFHFSVELMIFQPKNEIERLYLAYKANLATGFFQHNSPPPKICFQQA